MICRGSHLYNTCSLLHASLQHASLQVAGIPPRYTQARVTPMQPVRRVQYIDGEVPCLWLIYVHAMNALPLSGSHSGSDMISAHLSGGNRSHCAGRQVQKRLPVEEGEGAGYTQTGVPPAPGLSHMACHSQRGSVASASTWSMCM